ncbi:MAG: hypothetical protein J6K31_06275 [Parabacteroides sp.]|nr:hypothetical protein [Parabacteroides sp.]
MNKKFSTLLTAGLLVGGSLFCNVNAVEITGEKLLENITKGVLTFGTDRTYTLTSDCAITNGFLVINEKGAILDGQGHTFVGRIVVNAEGVTIKNLKIENKSVGTGYWQKNAITVFADDVTITGVDFVAATREEDEYVANNIVLMPKVGTTVNYAISGNTFRANLAVVSAASVVQSTGILIDVSCQQKEGDPISGSKTVQPITDETFDFVEMASGNTFENSWMDYAQLDNDNEYVIAKVTPFVPEKETGSTLKMMANDIISSSAEGATLIVNATAEDVMKVLPESLTGNNVALQCNDMNVLIGTAENPDNGKSAVAADVTKLDEAVFGAKLYTSETSDFAMLIMKEGSKNYAIQLNDQDKASAVEVTGSNIAKLSTDKSSLWKMSRGQNSDGSYYYRFESMKKGSDGKAIKLNILNNDAFKPAKNVVYNKYGVIFNISGTNLNGTEARYFGLYKAGNNILTAEQLNWYEQDGFSVTIKYQDPEDATKFTEEDIAGNPFLGHLTPMSYDKTTHKFSEAAGTADKFYLMNADGDYIVAQKYASSGSVTAQNTYTFTTITAQELAHEIERAEGKYFGEFQAEVSAKYTNLQTLSEIDVLKVKVGSDWNTIGRLDLGTEEVPTLAASLATQLKPIKIALGSDEIVKAKDLLKKGKFYTVERIASKATPKHKLGFLSVAQDDQYNGSEFVSTYGNDLEIQWALTRKGGKYVFTNREANYYTWGEIAENALYKTATPDEYRYGTDTYRIKAVAEHHANDGYVTLDDVKNNKFHIGFSSNVFKSNAWFTENHSGTDNHTIGLDTDLEKALEFTATEYAAARTKKHLDEEGQDHSDWYYPSDSIYVISTIGYYDGNTYKEDCKDTLKVVSYSFVNQFIEPLIWNEDEKKYESLVYENKTSKKRFEKVEDAAKVAHKFAIRKDGEKRNLRLVNHLTWNEASKNATAPMHQEFNEWRKVYAGDATTGLLSTTYLYNRTENDLFVVEPTAKPMYRPVINPLDTISIFRNDNEKSILFEDKSFLGMENLAQYPQIAPGMVADTAYVRNETYRPQYMLVVGPEIHPEGLWCPIHGEGATCEHAVPTNGWVEGRYLVNLVDTAIAWNNDNKHKGNNPYINSENYYRLGFVQAKHIEDSLIIASTNDTLIVGTPEYNQAKFAFRYVDTEDESFVIETANFKKLPNATEAEQDGLGYIKWMNGVVVVVDDIKNADVFNMDEEFEGQPTDNETIATSEIAVIAGEGQVTIAGAAGKKVVISNILGQVVVNTVITSDNAVIAAPQGVVVVAVEGEEAVKAIVK